MYCVLAQHLASKLQNMERNGIAGGTGVVGPEQLASLLHAEEPPIPVVVGGSIITPVDRDEVLGKGIDAAVLPTAPSSEVIETVRALAESHHRSLGTRSQ